VRTGGGGYTSQCFNFLFPLSLPVFTPLSSRWKTSKSLRQPTLGCTIILTMEKEATIMGVSRIEMKEKKKDAEQDCKI
jgi:hypothetical protein